MPQRNALPGLIFVIIFAAGLLAAYASLNPAERWRKRRDCGRELLRRLDRRQCDQGRQSVGAGRRPSARQVPLARRAGTVLHRPDPRRGRLPDRHSRHHEHVQGGTDDDPRHGPGRRRRGVVLEGGRSEDGGARRRRLCFGDQLGGADGAPRRDRQDHAGRHARRAREAQRRIAAHHRCAHRAVGRQRHFGRGQGRADPRRASGRNVDAGPGRARAPGARHPGRFRTAGGGEVRRGGEDLRRQPDRVPPACDEHALRGPETQQRDDRHRALDGGRVRCSSAACRRWRRSRARSLTLRPRGRRRKRRRRSEVQVCGPRPGPARRRGSASRA